MKIEILPNVTYSPELVLHSSLEHQDTESVVVLMYKKDNTVHASWSHMDMSRLVFMARHLQICVDDVLAGRREPPA